jgi:glucosamine--fructose-6-phosphate aminotransferase (isomerizing)
MSHLLQDITEQPAVLQSVLEEYTRRTSTLSSIAREWALRSMKSHVVITGMGSSFTASYPGATYLNNRGVPTFLVDASELLHYQLSLAVKAGLLVVVSQSGESVEIRRLIDVLPPGVPVVAITNNSSSNLARRAQWMLELNAGDEWFVPSKTQTATQLTLLLFASYLAGDNRGLIMTDALRAIDAIERFLGNWQEPVERAAQQISQTNSLTVIARGYAIGAALAGAVIIEETARLQARAISGGQFRHTSLETVRPDFHACMLIGTDGTRNLMIDMASELAGYGGNIVLVGHNLPQHSAHVSIELPNSSPQFTPLVQIVPLQLLAYTLAQGRGLEPGRFDRLSKVIKTE